MSNGAVICWLIVGLIVWAKAGEIGLLLVKRRWWRKFLGGHWYCVRARGISWVAPLWIPGQTGLELSRNHRFLLLNQECYCKPHVDPPEPPEAA